jgi:nicotinate-nucleotide adenylyltransferase
MRTGILGGTFDPIHKAHVYLAREYCKGLGLDTLVLVPAFIPPHKPNRHLADANQRLDMCELAIQDFPQFELCDYEIMSEGKSYTYKTLRYLQELHPGAELFLLMGADMFFTVQDWRRPEEIFKMATICAAEREHGTSAALEAQANVLRNRGARCELLEMKPMPLSSTMIRAGLKAGEDVSGLLDPKVYDYITTHKLYVK